MKNFRIVILGIIIILASCTKKSVQLPVLSLHGIQDTIYNNSQIWIFSELENGKPIAKMNKNNKLTNTDWIFNIDKSLPLEQVIPNVIVLQKKKAAPNLHDNGEDTHLYYSYVDTMENKLSLLLFDSVRYNTTEPIPFPKRTEKQYVINATNQGISIDNHSLKLEELDDYISTLIDTNQITLLLQLDNKLSYQYYLHLKAILRNIDNDLIRVENTEYLQLD